MRKFLLYCTRTLLDTSTTHVGILIFRVLISVQLMVVHGFKKIGIGVSQIEDIPNPLHLPLAINDFIAITANLIFPLWIIFGFFTRFSVLPILAVTLTGYFVVHGNDSLLIRDIPFMYSITFLFLLVIGPGKYSIDHLISKKLQQ